MSRALGNFEDAVANAVLEKFNDLPAKSKPAGQANGLHWVPLSGIVVSRNADVRLECVALGTGMKCLPAARVPETKGFVLHDWHAEVLAIRAFNHFVLQECVALSQSPEYVSTMLRRRETDSEGGALQPFTVREDVTFHMYCSEAPCGDASMELVMNAQEDATPWPVSDSISPKEDPKKLRGRENFSELGIVRRKPARGDSLPTLSKSCSDKLALKHCSSLLNSITCLLISPVNAYLETLVLPRSQYLEPSVDRAFGPQGRMKPVAGKTWPGGYSYRPFNVRTTELEFDFSRRSLPSSKTESKGSNVSAVWTPNIQETLVNGVLQGRKQADPKGASAVSKRRMWEIVSSAIGKLDKDTTSPVSELESEAPQQRRLVKDDVTSAALTGWIRNHDDGFERKR